MAFDNLPGPSLPRTGQIGLNNAALSSGDVALANVTYIRGAFKVYESESILQATDPMQFSDGQIVYCQDTNKLYQMEFNDWNYSVDPPTPPSKASASFQWPGTGGSGSIDDAIVTASIAGNIMTFTKGDGDTFDITLPAGSGSSGTGIFIESGSSGVFVTTGSLLISSSVLQKSANTHTGSAVTQSNDGTGGNVNKYSLVSSQSVWHYSDNIGVPTSKAWKTDLDGSYFNNFDHNTDTAEIVRFMAGLLKSQAPDVSPNTQTFSGISENITGDNIASNRPQGRIPLNSTNSTINYLISKGFGLATQPLFNGITNIYDDSSYRIRYSSVAGGSTTVSSSNDPQLFGLGEIGDEFKVRNVRNFEFEDNNSSTLTANTGNTDIVTANSPQSANPGLTLANIPTGNDLINERFQDGKFQNEFSANLFNNSVSFTTTGSIGFYEISASISIQIGTDPYSSPIEANRRIFYAPISNLNTAIPANSISVNNPNLRYITATSRSLSGAPYLLTATYEVSSSVSNLFNPLYAASTVARYSESDALVQISHPTGGSYTSSLDGGTIQTTDSVYTAAGVARGLNDTPNENDIVRLTASLDFNAGSSRSNNISAVGLSATNFAVNTIVVDKNSSSTTPYTHTVNYISPGAFGNTNPLNNTDPMAYYGYAQGNDNGTLTGTTEQFTGESYRLKIDNQMLAGTFASGTPFVTGTYDVSTLAKYDLQVKPGYLVYPGGSNGYWLQNPDTSTDYKYYARAFQTSGTKSKLKLSIGQQLVEWGSTSDGIAAAVMLQSAASGTTHTIAGATTTLPRSILYDFATLTGPNPASNQSNNNQLNPFTTNIDVGGNQNGGNYDSGTKTYTINFLDNLYQFLNGTYNNYIILLRYKGDPTPVQSINVSYI